MVWKLPKIFIFTYNDKLEQIKYKKQLRHIDSDVIKQRVHLESANSFERNERTIERAE